MAKRKAVTVITYNGIDGACAAAMVLLKYPHASLGVSSAARVGQALQTLGKRSKGSGEVHVCGLGVYCDWEDVAKPCLALRRKGVRTTWYCGRGYLKESEGDFARICTPVFGDLGTNAEAVCRHLGLGDHGHSGPIISLARLDPHIGKDRKRPTEEQAFWMDLIDASIAQYLKYQDEETYCRTVRHLADLAWDRQDERMVTVFRQSGFRHVLWGRSQPMGELRSMIRRCAELDEPILITGESGVGKEYVAHLIHERSDRAMGPFIPVNCALFAGNPALANSALFGHVKGAFTGAVNDRAGAFVSAHTGILFLDELAELPMDVQAKFLRVLEDGWVTPEGSDEPRQVDVRVLAATNRELPALIREGKFRPDLYHRLDILQVRVPPLREHIEDVGQIVEHVLDALEHGNETKRLAKRDLQLLREYGWPGNVRQLIKVIKRSQYLGLPIKAVLDEEQSLGALVEGTEQESDDGLVWPMTVDQVQPLRDIRRAYAVRALALHHGNYTATARALGIAVNTLRAYLEAP